MKYDQLYAENIPINLFDLRHTFESAQPLTFHADYNSESNSMIYSHNGHIINVRYSGDSRKGNLIVASKDLAFARREVAKRFRLHDNMKSMYKRINTDKYIAHSIKNYEGMRLTHNDQWETTLCYIISQYNNVKRIRQIVRKMKSRFGTEIKDDHGNLIARNFPESRDLLKVTEKQIRECGAGFRAKYIKEAAEYCTYNLDLYKLNPNKYDDLKEQLMTIIGVGDKVADCIILMGYGNLRAFPVDVWIKRTVEKIYFKGRKQKIDKIHEFAEKEWGKNYCGYAQQYLFWAGRQMNDDFYELE